MPTGFSFFTKVMEQVLRQTILLLYQVQDPLNPFNVVGFAFLEALIERRNKSGHVRRNSQAPITLANTGNLKKQIALLLQIAQGRDDAIPWFIDLLTDLNRIERKPGTSLAGVLKHVLQELRLLTTDATKHFG